MTLNPDTSREGGGGGGGDVTLVFSHTLGAAAATVDTDSILGGSLPATYSQLRFQIMARSDRAAQTADFVSVQFNGDGSSIYDTVYFQLDAGASGASGRTSATAAWGSTPATSATFLVPGAASTAGAVSSAEIVLPAYAGSTFWKNAWLFGVATLGAGDHRPWESWAQYRSTSPIARMVLTMANGQFIAGSQLVCWGMT